MDDKGTARPIMLDWRGRLAGTLLGSSVAGGLSINILSGDYRWRIVVVALSAGTLIAISSWLHRRPSSAIARWSIRALLALASAAGLLALLGPAAVRPWSSVGTAALTVGAVLVPRGHEAAIRMLFGAASTGIGLTSIVIAADSILIKDDPGMLNAYALAGMAVGAAGVALGWTTLSGSRHPGHGIIRLGAALGLCGLVMIAGGPRLQGFGLAVGGIATALFGMGWTKKQYSLHGLGLVGIGVSSLVISVSQLSAGHFVYGFIFLSHAILTSVSGFGLLVGNVDLVYVSQVGAALTNAVLGVVLLVGGKPMYGIGLLGVATGGIATSLYSLWHGDLGRRMLLWWHAVSTEPASQEQPH